MNQDNRICKEAEFNDAVDSYVAEAGKTVAKAFYEGFMLGQKHAESLYGKGDEDE